MNITQRVIAKKLVVFFLLTFSITNAYACFNKSDDDKTNFSNCLQKANIGDADAQVFVGVKYYEGKGVAKNFEKGFLWTEKAANQDHVEAQGRLGAAYYEGIGIKKDVNKAIALYKTAAEKGNAIAQTLLGIAYAEGEVVAKDKVLGYMWLTIAMEKYKDARFNKIILSDKMTAKQKEKAEKMAIKWKQEH